MNLDLVNLLTIDGFCLLLGGMILFRLRALGTSPDAGPRLYLTMVWLTMVLVLLDALFWLFEGQAMVRSLLVADVVLYFIGQPALPVVWILYTRQFRLGQGPLKGWKLRLLLLPLAVNAIMVLVSSFSGWYFTIGIDGAYRRGPWFIFEVLPSYLYSLVAIGLILVNRRFIAARIRGPLVVMVSLPILAGIVQSFVVGLNLMWPAIIFSLLVIYLGIEAQMLALDFLTGLENRRSLISYLQRRMAGPEDDRNFGLIMLDLDDFKSINDTWGHREGDQALIATAAILRSCFHHMDFICRYGGDEFVVVLDLARAEALESARSRLMEKVEHFNQENPQPWTLSLSYGYLLHNGTQVPESSPEELMDQVDRLMYRHKRQRN